MLQAVERTLAILECFTPERSSLTLQEIANRIKLHKSTTFRWVQSLDEAGYLIRLDNYEYCLSFRVTRLAGLVKSTLDIRNVARVAMRELAEKSNETVTLNMRSGNQRVCIDVLDTPSPLMSVTKPGTQLRLETGATAKVLMAALPKDQRDPIIRHAVKAAGRTRNEFLAELEDIRSRGFALSHSELVLGLTAISAPITDAAGAVTHCITVTGPSVRMQPREKEVVKLVLKAARDISRRLGAEPKLL